MVQIWYNYGIYLIRKSNFCFTSGTQIITNEHITLKTIVLIRLLKFGRVDLGYYLPGRLLGNTRYYRFSDFFFFFFIFWSWVLYNRKMKRICNHFYSTEALMLKKGLLKCYPPWEWQQLQKWRIHLTVLYKGFSHFLTVKCKGILKMKRHFFTCKSQ